jgi:hypothetical protein
MHPSIYREFSLSLAPNHDADGRPGGEIYVRLQHAQTGQEAVFKLTGSAGSPERWVEEQVLRIFPDSAAAAELRVLYGLTRHTFKKGWSLGFGDRVYLGIEQQCRNKAGRFWAELIPTLPPVLYATMTARAVARLERLGAEFELRTVIKTVHDAWFAVLREARGITMNVTGLERLALDLHGWPTELMRNMSILDYGRLKEKALFAKLALGYLSEEDWTAILSPLLEPVIPPVAPALMLKAS